MELSPTARVILGFLAAEPRSGYDIKSIVDHSTRFFWAASYGQIYPELKRLAERGLIEAEGEAEGGRRRTTWRITDAGREALAGWIRSTEVIHELRDENLLKVFFADLVGREEAIAALEAAREIYREKLETLKEIEPHAAAAERFGPYAVLQHGLANAELGIRWCDKHLERLKEEK